MALYFITGNKGKFNEVSSILREVEQLDIDLPEIQELKGEEVIKAKLIEALKHKKGEFIVEDTSLYLDCLNGLPGPLIKWFMKSLGSKGIYELVQRYGNFKAKAVSIVGYAKGQDSVQFFRGEIEGTIVAPRGDKGFGWDNIFVPKGYDKTFAEMESNEKNKISMRRVALLKLKDYLENR